MSDCPARDKRLLARRCGQWGRASLCLVLLLPGCHRAPAPGGPGGAFEASLAVWHDGLAVAWYDTRDGCPEIFAQAMDAPGRPRGAEHRLSPDGAEAYEADIDPLGDGFAAAWYEERAGRSVARLGVWSRDGAPAWVSTLSATGRNPLVRSAPRGLFAAWIEAGGDVRGGWWDAAGAPLGPPLSMGRASPSTWNLNAAIDARGDAHVVFDAVDGTRSDELFLACTDVTQCVASRLTADDGHPSKYPDLAIAGGRAAIAWYDARDGNDEVYLAVVPLDALAGGVEAAATRITRTPGDSLGAYVSWSAPYFGVVWSDDTEGNAEIYFQAFSVDGVAAAPARRVTRSATASLAPAIRPWPGGFVLAWNEYAGPGGGSSVVVSFVPAP